MKVVFVLTASYLLGSIPWGYLVGVWWKGLDIRRYGSGNIGTTNAFRILGPGPGTVVLLGDILKGTLAVLLAKSIGSELLAVAAGLAAIAGHSWSIFLGFRGGRGVATGAGVILGLVPLAIPVLFLLWAGTILVTRYVSVGSITAAVAAPVVMGWVGHSWLMALLGLLAGAAVIIRHQPNLERLRRGVEPRIGEHGSWRP